MENKILAELEIIEDIELILQIHDKSLFKCN